MFNLRKAAVGLFLMEAALSASAATRVEIANPPTSGFAAGSSTVTHSPAASTIWVFDGDNPAQAEAGIESLAETVFGLPSTGPGSFMLVGSGDLAGTTSGGSLTAPGTTDYLAIQHGPGESPSHRDIPLAATFGGLPHDIGNYPCPTMPVPEPATYGMLVAGLAMIGCLARRRKPDDANFV